MKTAITALILLLSTCTAAQEQQPSPAPEGRPIPNEIPYQISGSVKPPKPIHTPDPKHFKHYREGKVVLACVIGSDGMVREPRVVSSLSPEGDASTLEAVRKWKFKPATLDGKPVAVRMEIQVTYR